MQTTSIRPLDCGCRVSLPERRTESRFAPSACADRMYRWCVMSALPLLDQQGRIVKWYGTVVDMHDWKQAQEDLRNTQAELAHMARVMTMGELTASIAHEVNQPLSAIIASGDSCSAWLSNEPPNLDKARAATSRMIQAATQASEIVQRLRALFKKTTSITCARRHECGNRRYNFPGPP